MGGTAAQHARWRETVNTHVVMETKPLINNGKAELDEKAKLEKEEEANLQWIEDKLTENIPDNLQPKLLMIKRRIYQLVSKNDTEEDVYNALASDINLRRWLNINRNINRNFIDILKETGADWSFVLDVFEKIKSELTDYGKDIRKNIEWINTKLKEITGNGNDNIEVSKVIFTLAMESNDADDFAEKLAEEDFTNNNFNFPNINKSNDNNDDDFVLDVFEKIHPENTLPQSSRQSFIAKAKKNARGEGESLINHKKPRTPKDTHLHPSI